MICEHPIPGSILVCDFSGFVEPEMTKRRPVIVVSRKIASRPNLCTIVPLSTTEPKVILPMHYLLEIDPPLPYPYNSRQHWVKGDMLYALRFERLFYLKTGKDASGKRAYVYPYISADQLSKVQKCIMAGIGIFKY
jgi:uncharacterized protein YifN (PemK superfamily)